jgi:hypothetical protein
MAEAGPVQGFPIVPAVNAPEEDDDDDGTLVAVRRSPAARRLRARAALTAPARGRAQAQRLMPLVEIDHACDAKVAENAKLLAGDGLADISKNAVGTTDIAYKHRMLAMEAQWAYDADDPRVELANKCGRALSAPSVLSGYPDKIPDSFLLVPNRVILNNEPRDKKSVLKHDMSGVSAGLVVLSVRQDKFERDMVTQLQLHSDAAAADNKVCDDALAQGERYKAAGVGAESVDQLTHSAGVRKRKLAEEGDIIRDLRAKVHASTVTFKTQMKAAFDNETPGSLHRTHEVKKVFKNGFDDMLGDHLKHVQNMVRVRLADVFLHMPLGMRGREWVNGTPESKADMRDTTLHGMFTDAEIDKLATTKAFSS